MVFLKFSQCFDLSLHFHINKIKDIVIRINFMENTAWKVSVFGVFLVHIFRYSDSIRSFTLWIYVFSPNARKYEPEKLQIRKFFHSENRYTLFSYLLRSNLNGLVYFLQQFGKLEENESFLLVKPLSRERCVYIKLQVFCS